jgi:soluble cytochrome b562
MAAVVRSNRGLIALIVVMFLSAGFMNPVSAQETPAMTLDRAMGLMNRAYRTVKANIKDATKNEATLAAIAQMQTSTLAAKGLIPATITAAPEADRAKMTREYRTMMAKLVAQEAELEQLVLAGENDKAAAVITAIDDAQKAGHAAFRKAE